MSVIVGDVALTEECQSVGFSFLLLFFGGVGEGSGVGVAWF